MIHGNPNIKFFVFLSDQAIMKRPLCAVMFFVSSRNDIKDNNPTFVLLSPHQLFRFLLHGFLPLFLLLFSSTLYSIFLLLTLLAARSVFFCLLPTCIFFFLVIIYLLSVFCFIFLLFSFLLSFLFPLLILFFVLVFILISLLFFLFICSSTSSSSYVSCTY